MSFVDFTVIGCMPVDRSKLPQSIPEVDDIVITDLYTLSNCDVCACDMWMGPRQKSMYDKAPYLFRKVCYVCIFEMMEAGAELDTVQLGGGYPNEGRPRTQ